MSDFDMYWIAVLVMLLIGSICVIVTELVNKKRDKSNVS